MWSNIERDCFWDLTAFCAGATASKAGIRWQYCPFHYTEEYYYASWMQGWQSIRRI